MKLYEVSEIVDIFKYESILWTKLIFLSSSIKCPIARELHRVVLTYILLTLVMGIYGLCHTAE